MARYLIKARDITNNGNMKVNYFPSSLTKNAFTWFTMLPASSFHYWTHLERLFHEQFYMEQSKISLKELASIKRKFTEPIDEYHNRFRLLKARCFTQVLEHELIKMAAGGLDYSVRKKLDTQYLRHMSQLADRVRQVERLKTKKDRANKNNRRERVAYFDLDGDDHKTYSDFLDFDEREINLAELKQGPPYSCKVLAPSNGKNPIEPEKNDKFPKKTYTFDVIKCDKFFDLLVKDGQMIVPSSAKIPPLEQRKKRSFCKYHNFLGHNTSQCFIFRDLVKNVIRDGRLKFGDRTKSQMKIDLDPLQVVDAHYVKPFVVNMMEVSEAHDRNAMMFETTEGFKQETTKGFV
ncbi:uncharacterized protein LOC127122445 [Lathyrus oleraceus]|uniref:uncharacterized protein LOC127122445 n=1 Tax=Pisum sativum TaxID=3888 RepID=UPI0021D24BB7|nr:uncharacterized protein LOC127122445 [Pisum sativum]